jgi:hypothetical protein
MKKPLQHRILDLLADGPMNFSVLCDRLAPDHTNRTSITATLQAMKHDNKVRATRVLDGFKSGQVSIWELAPAVSNALFDCWPVRFQPLPGTVRKHRLEL